MKLKMKCEKCHREFKLHPNDVREVDVEHGKLTITLYTCPHCKSVYPVQLDDRNSKAILYKLKKEILKGRTIAPNKDTVKAIEEYEKQLTKARQNLVSKYNGSVYQLGTLNIKLDFKRPAAENAGLN